MDTPITKTQHGMPISREPTVTMSPKELFLGLADTLTNLVFKGWLDGGTSALGALAKTLATISIGETTSEKAWSLIAGCFGWAVGEVCDIEALDPEKAKKVMSSVISDAGKVVDDGEQVIPPSFFESPTTLPLYRHMKFEVIKRRLEIGISEKITDDALSHKMDIAFNRAIYEVWVRRSPFYDDISKTVKSPANNAVDRDLSWYSYRNILRYNFELSPVFGKEEEGISLSQLYVPLRCFWSVGDEETRVSVGESKIPRDAKVTIIDKALEEFLNADDQDWLRLIGGGPGSGKSTTLKSFACRISYRDDWRPIFVSLQHIGIAGDLRTAIGKSFTEYSNGSFKSSPLDRVSIENGPPIVLIFDGLDELIAPNEAAADVINMFSARLNSLISSLKGDGSVKLKVIVSGRMPAFQAAQRFLAPQRHGCLEVFGYLPVDSDNITSDDQLWQEDQRGVWWKNTLMRQANLPIYLRHSHRDNWKALPMNLSYVIYWS
jgi:hypothetical protein